MTSRGKLAELAGLVKAKRKQLGVGLREAAVESGVSASTLSRLERGAAATLPDVDTLTRLSKWLGTPIGHLIDEKDSGHTGKRPHLGTPEKVEVFLRADKNLSPETASALSTMFRVLYDQLTRDSAAEAEQKSEG
jgi:transcriptional regulator with XRE-family HTH domain